jgi:hypothetical protein
MEHSPHVCSIPPAELMAFCSDSGYRCRLELEGSLLMPPEYNVHVTDWERSLRLRCVEWPGLCLEPGSCLFQRGACVEVQPECSKHACQQCVLWGTRGLWAVWLHCGRGVSFGDAVLV